MVYIKKLEIYGFKSFGFKNTVLHFDNGLVAVTGPNGSGKSNILDAIMFVLGENSPKALRVDKFQSLFYDAQSSSHRLIRVSISFDNSDRGIPVDTDTVSMSREMEGQSGDSQYYLNGKKVSKMTILELLEIVVAAPNKLNIVQQGMITRISELNVEERRRIIEDIIGLSYFDEKRTEALNQLSESDRRLEVAMARMGEIRKRINELEGERNDQLRYNFLESQLKRFKAILYSNKIDHLRKELQIRTQMLEKNASRLIELSTKINELQKEIDTIDAEKTNFMQEVDVSNKTKAQLDTKITSIVYELERTKAIVKESDRRLEIIGQRLPAIKVEQKNLDSDFGITEAVINEKGTIVRRKREALTELKARFDQINSALEELSDIVTKNEKNKAAMIYRRDKLLSIDSNLKIIIARLEERSDTLEKKINSNQSRVDGLRSDLISKKEIYEKLINEAHSALEQQRQASNILVQSKRDARKIEEDLRACSEILNKAQEFSTSYQTRIALANSIMNEDFALVELFNPQMEFRIVGLVKDLLRWDPVYQKAVFAAASDWMKACVVYSIKDMIKLASYLKERNIPRLRIIPLELVKNAEKIRLAENDHNIIGNLADFVQSSSIKNLPTYLFGNIILVRTASKAYDLSQEGYRTVTVDGELFEPRARSMLLDFGSKISDLTLDIILSNHINSLTESSKLLEEVMKAKQKDLREINNQLETRQISLKRFDDIVTESSINTSHLNESISMLEKTIVDMDEELLSTTREASNVQYQLQGLKRRVNVIENAVNRYSTEISKSLLDNATSEFSQLNSEKKELFKLIEMSEIETREMVTSYSSAENEFKIQRERKLELESELEMLKVENEEKIHQVETGSSRSEYLEAELIGLREEEQRIIETAGGSYSVLQEYEKRIKVLSEQERQLSREFNGIEKETVALKKDVSSFSSQESQAYNDLIWLGYKELVESEPFDVENLIRELTQESDEMRSSLNLRADESYVQVTEGYRGMSGRKNELESERNSIVYFIEEIVREKKTVFMEAFQKVDQDIRKTFSQVSGGGAYLQMENEEDVFSGGLMYLVQFPGKPPRESTALSGGEKTMAATIFLLALQALKPSPFYLMDEVDAHLDAQNTEKLSKVLFERSKGNQIIMVTLKDSTVAKADQIFGVYPKSGLSQVVHYRNPSHVPLAEVKTAD
ncbi:MAG: chromosome segregation SMC family protein [Nitrososphaeraceae archaeon]